MSRDDFTYAPGRSSSGIYGAAHGGDFSPNDGGHQTGIDLLPTHQSHVCRLDHCIRRLDHRDESFAFNHAQRFFHFVSLLRTE